MTSASFASRSAIPQFVKAFLERELKARGESRPREYTHMSGIPMAECHQLQIELESVQRVILYHCPPKWLLNLSLLIRGSSHNNCN